MRKVIGVIVVYRWSLLSTTFNLICPLILIMACLMTSWHFPTRALSYLVALLIASVACHGLSLILYESTVAVNLYMRRNMFL